MRKLMKMFFFSVVISLFIFPIQAFATELLNENEYFVSQDTYLYETDDLNGLLGIIQSGSIINPSEITEQTVLVTYDGVTGYIDADYVTKEVSEVEKFMAENGLSSIEINETRLEILYPVSHYVDSLYSVKTISNITKFTSDKDVTNDYVIVCASDNFILSGINIYTAYMNGCETLSIQYAKDQMNSCIYFEIPTWECNIDQEWDMSFTYDNNKFCFSTNATIPENINIGFKGTEDIQLIQNGAVLSTEVRDEIVWIALKSKDDIEIICGENVASDDNLNIQTVEASSEQKTTSEVLITKKTDTPEHDKKIYFIIVFVTVCVIIMLSKAKRKRIKLKN